MKDPNTGKENGPRGGWGSWRAKRDQAIRTPKRSRAAKAVAELERVNREARGEPATLEEAIADNERELKEEDGK